MLTILNIIKGCYNRIYTNEIFMHAIVLFIFSCIFWLAFLLTD